MLSSRRREGGLKSGAPGGPRGTETLGRERGRLRQEGRGLVRAAAAVGGWVLVRYPCLAHR